MALDQDTLDLEKLIAEVSAQEDLFDYGDPIFVEPITRLFSSVLTEARLNAGLEHRDGGGPHRLGRLTVEPGHHRDLRVFAHQRGQHAGVEKDHALLELSRVHRMAAQFVDLRGQTQSLEPRSDG